MIAQKVETFAQVEPKTMQLVLRGNDIRPQLIGMQNHVASLTHKEVAEE